MYDGISTFAKRQHRNRNSAHLLLSQMLMSLKSYEDLTKGLFVVAKQKYDDEPVTFSYMAEISQEVAAVLPIIPLLLKGRLGMTVSRYFRSSYSIETMS